MRVDRQHYLNWLSSFQRLYAHCQPGVEETIDEDGTTAVIDPRLHLSDEELGERSSDELGELLSAARRHVRNITRQQVLTRREPQLLLALLEAADLLKVERAVLEHTAQASASPA